MLLKLSAIKVIATHLSEDKPKLYTFIYNIINTFQFSKIWAKNVIVKFVQSIYWC